MVVGGCWPDAAEAADEADEELPLILSFRPMVAEEETIILRKFEVSVSEETNEEQGPAAAAVAPEEFDPSEAEPPAELVALELELALLTTGTAGSMAGVGLLSCFCCCCLLLELPPTATIEAALALAGITGLAFASAIWWWTRSRTSPQTSKLGLTINSIKPVHTNWAIVNCCVLLLSVYCGGG